MWESCQALLGGADTCRAGLHGGLCFVCVMDGLLFYFLSFFFNKTFQHRQLTGILLTDPQGTPPPNLTHINTHAHTNHSSSCCQIWHFSSQVIFVPSKVCTSVYSSCVGKRLLTSGVRAEQMISSNRHLLRWDAREERVHGCILAGGKKKKNTWQLQNVRSKRIPTWNTVIIHVKKFSLCLFRRASLLAATLSEAEITAKKKSEHFRVIKRTVMAAK